MAIDNQLDRPAAPDETLARTLESMLAIQRDGQARIEKLETTVLKLDDSLAELTDTINRLANIVIRHEEDLDALDSDDQAR